MAEDASARATDGAAGERARATDDAGSSAARCPIQGLCAVLRGGRRRGSSGSSAAQTAEPSGTTRRPACPRCLPRRYAWERCDRAGDRLHLDAIVRGPTLPAFAEKAPLQRRRRPPRGGRPLRERGARLSARRTSRARHGGRGHLRRPGATRSPSSELAGVGSIWTAGAVRCRRRGRETQRQTRRPLAFV